MATSQPTTFDEFFNRAQELFLQHPDETRFSVKYRPSEQRLYLRCTDNRKHIRYYTEDQAEIRKADRLNTLMMTLMALPHYDEETIKAAMTDLEAKPKATTTTTQGSSPRPHKGNKTRRV